MRADGYLKDYASRLEQEQAAAVTNEQLKEAYLAFSKQNTRLLEGKWSAGEGEQELEFVGDRIRFLGSESMLISTRMRFDRTFLFNQNTIVIF